MTKPEHCLLHDSLIVGTGKATHFIVLTLYSKKPFADHYHALNHLTNDAHAHQEDEQEGASFMQHIISTDVDMIWIYLRNGTRAAAHNPNSSKEWTKYYGVEPNI
jgi:hypothetical protein